MLHWADTVHIETWQNECMNTAEMSLCINVLVCERVKMNKREKAEKISYSCVTKTMNALHIRFAITENGSQIEKHRKSIRENDKVRKLYECCVFALCCVCVFMKFWLGLNLFRLYRSFGYNIHTFLLLWYFCVSLFSSSSVLGNRDRILLCLFLTFTEFIWAWHSHYRHLYIYIF